MALIAFTKEDLTGDGAATGLVAVADTSAFAVGATVWLSSDTEDSVELIIDAIPDSTHLALRQAGRWSRYDCSAFATTDNAAVTQNEQNDNKPIYDASALSTLTSAELAGSLGDETGTGAAVFADGPTLNSPILVTPSISGAFTLTTPNIGVATGTSLALTAPAAGTGLGITATTSGTGVSAVATTGIGILGAATGAGSGVKGTTTTGKGIWAVATTGTGAYTQAAGAGGIATYAEGSGAARCLSLNPTGTPTAAALRWTPQGSAPSIAHIVGDAYMTNYGTVKVCTTAGTPGTFTSATRGGMTDRTADLTLNIMQTGGSWTNRGASGDIILTLPTGAGCTVGDIFRFRVAANFYLKVKCGTGDTVRNAASVSATAGYIRSTAIGSTLEVEYQGNNEFFVTGLIGTWTIDA